MTAAAPCSPARSDHVASFLRPPALLAEIHRIYERGHTTLHGEERGKDRTRLRELEDQAIREVVASQVDVGLDVLTDGEFRRVLFTNSFYDAVEGLEPNPEPLHFMGDDGSVVEHPRPALVAGRLRKVDSPGAREAEFLASLTDRASKITFPAASWFCFQSLRAPAVRDGTYESVLSSKSPRVESEDELLARIDEAARYLLVEQLAISPQCGFASALSALDGADGNEVGEDVQ